MTFLEKLDFMISNEKLNRRTFSQKSGIPYTTISNWYQRGYDNLTLAAFRKICDYFNVTMDSMAYDDREIEYKSDISPAALSREEQDLIWNFGRLDPRGQNAVLDTLQREAEYARKELKEDSVA